MYVSGDRCTNFDGCSSSPCMNDGVCEDVNNGDEADYTCTCTKDYVGTDCEV